MTDIYRRFNVENRSFSNVERRYSGQENDAMSTTLHFTYDPIDFLKDGDGFYYVPYIIFDVYDENGNPLMYGPSELTSQPVFDGYTFPIPWDVTSRVKSARLGYQLFFLRNDVVFDPYRDNVAQLDGTQYILSAIDGIALKPSISCKGRRNPCACPPMTPHSEPGVVGYINLWKNYGVVTPITDNLNEDNVVVLKFHTYSGANECEVPLDNVPALVNGKIQIKHVPTGNTEGLVPLLKGTVRDGKSIIYDEAKGGFVEYEVAGIYQFIGTCSSAQLDEMAINGQTTTGKTLANGMVYSLTNDRDFEGETYSAGTNWVWSEESRWEPLTGDLDLSKYQMKENLKSDWTELSDETYPSTKLVKESLDDKLDDTQIVTKWSERPLDTNIPSESLVRKTVDLKVDNSQIVHDLKYPSKTEIPSTKLLAEKLDLKLDDDQLVQDMEVPSEIQIPSTKLLAEKLDLKMDDTQIVQDLDKPARDEIPSAKLVSDELDKKVDDTQLVSRWSDSTSNVNIPSEKLVKDSLDEKTDVTMAIPEWDPKKEYVRGSTVVFGGLKTIYIALNEGAGHIPDDPDDPGYWTPIQGGGGEESKLPQSRVFRIVGNGEDKEFKFTHGLRTQDIFYQIRSTVPKKVSRFVDAEVTSDSINRVTVRFKSAPERGVSYNIILSRGTGAEGLRVDLKQNENGISLNDVAFQSATESQSGLMTKEQVAQLNAIDTRLDEEVASLNSKIDEQIGLVNNKLEAKTDILAAIPPWSPEQTYRMDSTVISGGKLYISINGVDNLNKEPGIETGYWTLIEGGGSGPGPTPMPSNVPVYIEEIVDAVQEDVNIRHNLGSYNLFFSTMKYDTKEYVDVSFKATDANNVTAIFSSIPKGKIVVTIMAAKAKEPQPEQETVVEPIETPQQTWKAQRVSPAPAFVQTFDEKGNIISGDIRQNPDQSVDVQFSKEQTGTIVLKEVASSSIHEFVEQECWVINHNLGRFVGVQTYNDEMGQIRGDVVQEPVNKNTVTI